MTHKTLTFKNGLHIEWNRGDDGGGSEQYLDFLDSIPADKKYNRCLEWCAGLSAIAFSLLDAKLINECVLMDIYEPALLKAMENANNNNLSEKVTYYVCDEIKKLPLTDKFDLIVSNPPHSNHSDWHVDGKLVEVTENHKRLTVDKNWKIHEEFFSNVTNYLNDGADVLLSETDAHNELIEMASKNSLQYIGSYPANILKKYSNANAVIMHFKYETKVH